MTATMTMMLVTLTIVAGASLMLNVYQWAERRAERKQTDRLIADAALLEKKLDEIQKRFENEKLHTEWAIGRLKDQQAVIDQLKQNIMPKRPAYKSRKEAHND